MYKCMSAKKENEYQRESQEHEKAYATPQYLQKDSRWAQAGGRSGVCNLNSVITERLFSLSAAKVILI